MTTITKEMLDASRSLAFTLPSGADTLIDEDQWPLLLSCRWHVGSKGYVQNRGLGQLHRLIAKAPSDLEVDHINGDRLDNRICNLRLATSSQNKCNATAPRANKTGMPGVSWDARRQRFRAKIKWQRTERHLGYFATREEAAMAYRQASLDLHGAFSRFRERAAEEAAQAETGG